MKHIFIINPAAGKCDRTPQIKEAVEQVFGSRGLDYELQLSQKPGDCRDLARAAAETGLPVRLYACGGDGTLNEVINGAAGYGNVSVTHYPAGSGNDFIKIFDRPGDFRDLERLLDCEEAEFDLICCSHQDQRTYAANICSVGLDARIAADMAAFRRMPLVSGNGAYWLATGVNVIKGIHRPFEISFDGRTVTGNQTLVCICNGRNYGGSFNPVPDAEPDDGMLDVLLVKPVSRLQVAQVVGHYQKGRYADFPELIRYFRTDVIRVCSPGAVVNVDGEILPSDDITFSVAPFKLRFFYPSGLRYTSKVRQQEKTAVI